MTAHSLSAGGAATDRAATARRSWLLYAGAWLPYVLVSAVASATSGMMPPWPALLWSFVGTVPAALFGLLVLSACRALPWPDGWRLGFVVEHVALAAAYALAVVSSTYALTMVAGRLKDGGWKWATIRLDVLPWELFMLALLYCVVASIAYAFQIGRQLREQEARAARAATLQARAELKALRAQLNPHFLFNTLHTLLALVRRAPAAAEEGIQQFGDLLRQSLRVQEDGLDEIPFAEEWAFVTNYLALEGLRLGDRLRLKSDVDPDALDVLVPSFCLQPLVENAIRHGIAPRSEGGSLAITARVEGENLLLEVVDDGPGGATVPAVGGPGSTSIDAEQGLGMRLVRERLEMIHGSRAAFEVEAPESGGFRVSLRIPARDADGRAALARET